MPNGNEWQSELLRIVQTGAGVTPSPAAPLAATNRSSAGTETADSSTSQQRAASDPVAELTQELTALRRQMSVAEDAARRQAEQLEQNTRAVLESASRPATAVANAAHDGISYVRGLGGLSFLGSPLINLARRLFSRQSETPVTDTLVSAPADPLQAQLAIASGLGGGTLSQVNYGADGLPRAVAPAAVSTAAVPAQNVTIQVQAMDSRSFIDHSDQIARAVREAMLHSHALNDVVGDM